MKLRRVVTLLGIGTAVVLVLLGLVLSSGVQTWALQRTLRSHPEWGLSVGRIAAGWGTVELNDVHLQRGAYEVIAPSVHAEVPMLPALLRRRVNLGRLNAARVRVIPAANLAAGSSTLAAASAPRPAPSPVRDFRGILAGLDLPFDFSAENVDVSGEAVFGAGRGHAEFAVAGGGIGPGRQGKLVLTGRAALADRAVKSITVHGDVLVTMKDSRTFGRVEAEIDAVAAGAGGTEPVRLATSVGMVKTDAAEEYSVALHGADRQLLTIRAKYPPQGGSFSGTWTLDLRDTDVTPFALGTPIPAFTAMGRGSLESDAPLTTLHAIGRIDAAVDRLDKWKPEFAAVGPVKVSADVDLARRAGVFSVTKLDASVATDHRVAGIRATQAFDFDPRTRQLSARDPKQDLLDVVLDGLPVRWLKPFLGQFEIDGSDLRGELVATPRSHGISLRSKSPLVISNFGVMRSGRTWVHQIDLSLNASADYTPQAWQAELSDVTARQNGKPVVILNVKAGQLAGPNEAVKATGSIDAAVPALLEQILGVTNSPLAAGDVAVAFTTSVGSDRQLQARVTLKNLAAAPTLTAEALPTVTADVRADIAATGKITVRAPITMERAGRKSDAIIAGTLVPSAKNLAVDGQIVSGNLVYADAVALEPVIGALRNLVPSGSAGAAPAGPIWAGWSGALALQLKHVDYSPTLQLNNVVGLVRVSGQEVKVENVHAAVGDTGEAKAAGAVSYSGGAPAGYSVAADLALSNFDVTPFFAMENPRQPPTVEGKFIITTKLAGYGASLGALNFTSESQLTSKGGVFRGIPASVGNLVENSGKLAGWIASAGNAITALAGRKDYDEIPNRSQAANQLARILAAISYDQLSVVISTDGHGGAEIRGLSVISPEIRLSGGGHGSGNPGSTIMDEAVGLEYKVRARGRPADLMKYLGVLTPKTDELGYAECTIPVQVEGTLARLDATEVSNRLVALAVEKTGLTEKAVDWINRLRGKSSN